MRKILKERSSLQNLKFANTLFFSDSWQCSKPLTISHFLQTYLLSTHLRREEMRVKSRDTDQWMSYRLLPENLKERIRRYEQYRWQETRGVDEEDLLMNLPKDLRRDIKRHLCLSLLMRVCSHLPYPGITYSVWLVLGLSQF